MENPMIPPQPVAAAPRRSKLAIWSLILAIPFFIPPFGIAALVLGIVAVVSISNSKGALGGKGMAITGIVLGAIGMVVQCAIVPVALLFPALSAAREQARAVACRSNLKQAGLAMLMYQNDNDGEFPLTVQSLVSEGYAKDVRIFACPSWASGGTVRYDDVDATMSYVYARPLTLVEGVAEPAPMMWDKNLHRTAQNRGVNVLFDDGYVEIMEVGELMGLLEKTASRYESAPILPEERPED